MNHFSKKPPQPGISAAVENVHLTQSLETAQIAPQTANPSRAAENEEDRPRAVGETGTGGAPQQPVSLGLGEEQLVRFQEFLANGKTPLARRRDIIEHYNRMIELFKTLNTGLSERHAASVRQDREAVLGRLDAIERTLNGVEGAVQIEIKPVLAELLELRELARPARPRRLRSIALLAVVAALGLGCGLMFADPILQFARDVMPGVMEKTGMSG